MLACGAGSAAGGAGGVGVGAGLAGEAGGAQGGAVGAGAAGRARAVDEVVARNWQSAHVTLSREYLGTWQLSHAMLTSADALYFPTSQSMHTEEPAVAWYFPA
jgi:hypothetical protein